MSKFAPKTIYDNFIWFKEDPFFTFHWYNTFEFIFSYLFSSYYKKEENWNWCEND